MEGRRLLGVGLGVLLLAGVGGGIWYSNTSLKHEHAAAAATAAAVTTRGVIGSEKEEFFADPRVIAAFARKGITVHVEKAGSRAIARGYDAKRFDFGFPSGAPGAAELKAGSKAAETYVPFYTPIVFASWKPIAEILVANGLAERREGGYFITDLMRLLQLVDQRARWRDLKNSAAFDTSKAVLVNSTDVRTSNSAAMYLS